MKKLLISLSFIFILSFITHSFAQDNNFTQITQDLDIQNLDLFDDDIYNYDTQAIDHFDIASSTQDIPLEDNEIFDEYWRVKCTIEKFPNKAVAKQHLHDKQFDVQSCYAEQTVDRFLEDNRHIIATVKITPARIIFKTENMIDRHQNAKLVIGEKQKWYTLYSNCYQTTCLLFPEGKAQNNAIVREMKRNQEFKLRFIDAKTHKTISLTFMLGNFQDIYPLIESTYKQMEDILHRYADSFVLSKKWV